MTTKTKPSWTIRSILVQVREAHGDAPIQTKEIEAEVWQTFAVHKPVHPWEFGWDVTHLPTGYRCLASAASKAAAKQFCVEVADVTDWSTLTTDNAKQRWPAMRERMLDAARKARP